ncbi:MAG: FKBP-type peptidyl-prolyl cis-trans isomerase [Clostridium sp.]|nr:FKBP-type peptidyl-prolyl cis-trans isomerase [Prevotella sp.]MCM1429763.1 FKBP-type peptidyl-prolyl cis-trans isomerase [Clostridium sp.]MCM1474922.1 FKBP-type peptidyl-prolyl cis-trans isomerase [Muribaculaceae bacterium]
MKENIVDKDMLVSYAYRLSDAKTGELLFATPTDAPDTFLFGRTPQIVPGLEAAMKGLKIGDRFEVELPPTAAFGEYTKENVLTLSRDIFMRDGKLAEEVKVGAELPMMTAEGYRVLGRVVEIKDSDVIMDFNHPFAGKTVKWEGEIVDLRPATAEELKTAEGGCCGGGCSGGCGGGCDSEGCSDGNCGGCH